MFKERIIMQFIKSMFDPLMYWRCTGYIKQEGSSTSGDRERILGRERVWVHLEDTDGWKSEEAHRATDPNI